LSDFNQITLYIISPAFLSTYGVTKSFELGNIADELPPSGLAPGAYVVFGTFSMAGDFANSNTPFQIMTNNDLDESNGGLALVMSDPDADPEDMGEGSNITLDTLHYGEEAIDSVTFFDSWVAEGEPAPEDSGFQNNRGISRCPNGGDTNNNENDFDLRTTTPGTANSCGLVPDPGDGKD
jgi:hypothetical protein